MPEIDGLLHDLCYETKNLRSQVTRAAIQSFVKLFTYMGHEVEAAKNLDSVLHIKIVVLNFIFAGAHYIFYKKSCDPKYI